MTAGIFARTRADATQRSRKHIVLLVDRVGLIRVFVEESLTEDEEIAFNAGTHTELIKMAFTDYQELVRPRILQG